MTKLKPEYKSRIKDLSRACEENFIEEKELALIRQEFLPKKQLLVKWLAGKDEMALLDNFIFSAMSKEVILYLQEAYPEKLKEIFDNLPEIALPCPFCDSIIEGSIISCPNRECKFSEVGFDGVEEWNNFISKVKDK